MAFFVNTVRVINEIFGSRKVNDEPIDLNIDSEQEAELDITPSCECIATDFSDDMLMMEIMRLGLDPSNYTKNQMMEIIFDKMNQSKPTSTQIEEKEQEQKSKNH